MKILYIGSGFVGACSAAVSAASGHQVLVFDVDKNKIEKLGSGDRDVIESCLFEKGLGDLLVRNADRIHFTADYSKATDFLDACDAIFMCLPTPEIGETGESDLSYYSEAAKKLAENLVKRNAGKQEKYLVIINKSTVPIDMVDQTKKIMDAAGVKNYGVVSNPEFLVEGKAIDGSLHPDRIVVGAWNQKDFEIMRQVYQRYFDSTNVKYIEVNPKEAAAGKLLANFYLFNKLALCFDVMGRTCESFSEVSFESIRKIFTSDPRLGDWGFYDSLYAGGSCFIKDSRSLSHQLKLTGQDASIVNETYSANARQLQVFMDRAKKDAGVDWKDKKVALLGTAFKRDTNDIRNSPSINVVKRLLEDKVKAVHCYDPAALDMFKKVYPPSETVIYFSDEFSAIKDADVIIISTDWPQFRGVADIIIAELKTMPLVMDGRRILQNRYLELQNAGFDIIAVGSPFIKGNK